MSDSSPGGLSAASMRLHGLELVRAQIASGNFTQADVDRWAREKDVGPSIHAIVKELAPASEKPSRSRSTPAASTQE